MHPLVSIVMPVFNCENTIDQAISSILWQTYPAWELIIIDDGSTDRTPEKVQAYNDPRIKFHSDGQNMKLAHRLNQTVEMSTGEYIARMDADDIAFPERIDRQVDFLRKNQDVDLVGSRVLIFQDDGQVVGTYPYRETHDDICRRPWSGFYLPHPTWMGKRSWFLKYPYRASMPKTQDQDLLLRTYHLSKFACIAQFLHGYRVEDVSLKKILIGRLLFGLSLLRIGRKRNMWQFYYGILEQLAKALIDLFAIASGLKYRIIKHRAMPVSEVVGNRWNQLWNKLDEN